MKAKLFLFALVLSCISIHCMAQESRFLQQETDDQGNVSYAKLNTDTSLQPISQSAALLKNMYSKRSADEFKPSEKRKEILDEQGFTHQYYQQYYRNVKVENGEATVHSDKQGNIETVFGYFKAIGEVDTNPALSEAQALEYALKHIGAETYKWQIPEEEQWIKEYYNDTYRPAGELVIVKDQLKTDRIYRLAYRFDIYAHKPMSRDYIWVDAITGDILSVESRIRFANATGTAATRYSGSRSITTDSHNSNYRLRETRNGVNISTFNMNRTGTYTSTDFTDNDNNWTTAEHSANNNNVALDAHWGAEMTYEYFKQVHSRNSWNNLGGPLLSYVNANLISLGYDNNDNAFWDGNKMTYGQGTFLPPLTTLDICAHEIAHGVCEATANLVYSGESGAINESLSDIWAACVENWATTNKQTWICGEDLGSASRSMSNPGVYGDPDTYGAGPYWYGSNADVHINSGIMNYWFYLLSSGGTGTNDKGNWYNVTGIGINKAAQIVYRAEAYYMTASTNFAFARMYTVAAATNIYGATSAEVAAVEAAWHAVGVVGSNPLTINGSKLILNAGNTFTLSGNSGGASVTWTWSDNLQKLSSSSTSITVKPVSATSNGAGWIQARAGNFVQQIAVWVGKPVISAITGERRVPNTGYTSFWAEYDHNAAIPSNGFQWVLNPIGFNSVYGPTSACLGVSFSDTGYYQLLVRATNANGTGEYFGSGVSVYDPSYYSNSSSPSSLYRAYPNPVSDELTVSPNQGITSVPAQSAGGNKTAGNKAYTVYLYNANGASVRQSVSQGDQTQLNVSGLPGGIYYLMIDTGDGSKPEVHKIIVKH